MGAVSVVAAIAVILKGRDGDRAARAWSYSAFLNQAEDRQQAIDDYGKAIALNPNFAEAYSNRGAARNDLGRNEEAIADFNEALELNPDYVNAHVGRGIAKYHLGRPEEAWADFDKAIELRPELEPRLSDFREAR